MRANFKYSNFQLAKKRAKKTYIKVVHRAKTNDEGRVDWGDQSGTTESELGPDWKVRFR